MANVIRRVKKTVRRNPLVWRYVLNLKSTLAYRLHGRRPKGEAARVLAELNVNGVAVTTAPALFGNAGPYLELQATVDGLETRMADQIERARAGAGSGPIGEKTFIVELLGREPRLDPEGIFARFALSDPVLSVANRYFNLCTRLRYYNVWHTLATDDVARESQLWHRDREDRLILKVFVYCSDVSESAGPFTYAPGTHPKGCVRQQADTFNEKGVLRSTDAQMARVLPREQWRRCVGPKGTIVFADTRGYHKGGEARTHDRIMYTCMFTSEASQSHEALTRPTELKPHEGFEQSYALRGQR